MPTWLIVAGHKNDNSLLSFYFFFFLTYAQGCYSVSLERERESKGKESNTFFLDKMKDSSDGFVRADQIDLKSLDEQLERHLNRVLTLENKNKRDADVVVFDAANLSSTPSSTKVTPFKKQRQEWEIDPTLLAIKTVIARGTFGTVHRGVYDSQDVAGEEFTTLFFFLPPPLFFLVFGKDEIFIHSNEF